MERGGRKGVSGVEDQVVVVSGVDGAEIQIAYNSAYECV